MELEQVKKTPAGNTVYTSCGFQSNLQVQFPQARFVTCDTDAATQSRTGHSRGRCVQSP